MSATGGASGRARPGDAVALAVLAVAVGWYVRRQLFAGFLPAHDVYAYYFPNMLYAARQLRESPGGLLWNRWQNCGEPFLANLQIGAFYPPNWLFALLDRDRALLAVHLFGAAVAAVGGYAFLRRIGARPLAALAAALVFLLGPMTMQMVTWSPIHIGSYCWLPVALLCGERLIAAPTLRNALALGLVLTIALLPGYPQMTLFIYLMLGVQLLVRVLAPGVLGRGRAVGLFALAAVLPLLLGAVALLPFAELWRESIRSRPLGVEEFRAAKNTAAEEIAAYLLHSGRLAVAALFGAAALWRADLRRHVLFFGAAMAFLLVAALGTEGPLGALYLNVPGMTMFRSPERFLWLSDLCCAGWVAVGLEAIARSLPAARGGIAGAARVVAVACLAVAAAWAMSNWTRVLQSLERSSQSLWGRATGFAALRAAMTPQDRAYLAHSHPFDTDFAFMHKSASLFDVAATFDYEPMTTRRYGEYFVMMRSGMPFTKLNQFLLGHYLVGWVPPAFRWSMLNLIGGRFLVFDAAAAQPQAQPWLRPSALAADSGLSVYENEAALPRAFFVGAVEVVADPAAVLRRLADGAVASERVALVEEAPASGFLGSAEPAVGAAVRFAIDRPAQVALEVDAPRRGFLFLSDNFYPGWRAEVDGRPVALQRANYAFRLVEVPQGRSRVVFRFRPTSLVAGAVTTLLTVIGSAFALLATRRRASGGER